MATTEGCHLHRVRPHQAVKLTASPLATARAADVFCQGRRGRDQDGTSSYGGSAISHTSFKTVRIKFLNITFQISAKAETGQPVFYTVKMGIL